MARFVFAAFLLCFSTVSAHHYEDLLNKTETLIGQAKAHVEHMLDLDVPNKDKIPPIVLNETSHLAHEIRQLETALKDKGQDATVSAAVTELGNIAATLEHPGTDPKEVNVKYFSAATAVLEQIKQLKSATDAELLITGALTGLSHDVDNYQRSVHHEVGTHDGHEHAMHMLPEGSDKGKVHRHGAGSSEESSEEDGGHHSHHHKHPHHDHHHH